MPGASLIQIAATDHRRLPKERQPVRRQRQQPVDRVPDADPRIAEDVGDQLERVLQGFIEVFFREGQLGR